MGYSKKELKMHIRYIKRVLKMIAKMEKWTWNPLCNTFTLKADLEKQLSYYEGHLARLKNGDE